MNKEIATRMAYLRQENRKWPDRLAPVPRDQWPSASARESAKRIGVFRSAHFLLQVFEDGGQIRLSINRALIDRHGDWLDGLDWDTLQELKTQAGFADYAFVEVFPAESDVVNVANMRHLWLLLAGQKIGWMTQPNLERLSDA